MLLCFCRALTVSPLSLGNFIKHVPYPCLNLSISRFNPKKSKQCFTTAAALRFSQFDNLNDHQKSQIHLYVDSLLQWNQVRTFFTLSSCFQIFKRLLSDYKCFCLVILLNLCFGVFRR